MYAIPVGTSGPRDAVESIRAARREIAAGHIVCIFAEGAITRTGNMLPFKRGMEKIVAGTDVPIVPVHLDRLWGSIFSFAGGKFFWKWPQRIPYPVTVSFGAPLPSDSSAQTVRQAIQELAADATAHRVRPGRPAGSPPDPHRAPQLEPLRHGGFHRPHPHLRRDAHRRRLCWPRAEARGRAGAGDGGRAAALVGGRRAGQPRAHAARQGAGQPELHRRTRSHGSHAIGAVRASRP